VVVVEQGAAHASDGNPVVPGARSGQAHPIRTSIERYDGAHTLAGDDLARVVAIHNACWDEWIPGDPPLSAQAYVDDDSFTHPPEVVERRLARDERGRVIGHGRVFWRGSEPGTSYLFLFVDPSHRREGVGRAVGAELVAAARAAGRSGVTIEAPEGGIAGKICEAAGMRRDMIVEQNRADVAEASDELLEGWVAAGEAAEGYSLVTYDAPCPDDLAAAFIDVRHVMNDAPRWEGEAEWSFTIEEMRAAEAAAARCHLDWWNVGVRHDATGELVGLSDVYLPRERPWLVIQGDTGVVEAHRGHRLGAWMKAVNHLRLRRERPEARLVQTWNASANEPMLRINRALGFRPVQRYQGWLLPLD
jgi:GNAT superfamily N-acetyltransferase